jgi:sulfoxide reductase heme-binding subunit YedZ
MGPPGRNLAWLAKHHFGKLRLASFVLCASPALWLGGEWLSGSLGINPLNRLLHFTGRWALVLLAVTLSVTPARRLSVLVSQLAHARYGKRVSDWNWLIRLRRQLGLFTFFYGCLHLAAYVAFDAGPDLGSIGDDLRQRPFIVLGFAAFVLLVPLVVTSNALAMKVLGGAWRKLHTLAYLVAALALAHFWVQAKVGDFSPLPYSLVLGALMGGRLLAWWRGERAGGVEVKER